MKKQILISLILLSSILSMNAQTRVPNDGVSPIWHNNDKVGIGTTTPYQQLSITGGIGFANQNSIDKKLFSPIDGTLEWFTHDSAAEHAFAVSHQGERRIYLNTKGHSYFIGGNVGIGTTTPYQQLSITGGIGFANQNSIDKKLFSPIDGTLEWFTHDFATEHAFAVSHQGERRVYLNTKGHSYFIGGNVGIGTTSPAYKLDVCGTIRANEVKVDLQGTCVPDFVFKKDYKLMSLNELEKFVTTKQHLPEIASEKEMIENGLNIKEFQMKLLQKVEELTLYTIEQNKRLKLQSDKNEKQEQELKILKVKIKKIESIKR